MATETAARRFNVQEYHKLAEVGILGEDDRVELLNGQIMVIAPIGENHRTIVDSLAELFTDRRKDRYRVASQNPILIDDQDEPQPDIVLYDRSVTGRHPTPGDIYLIVEVADTSLDYDQSTKIPIYAAAGVKEVWVVDLVQLCVHVFQGPDSAGRRYGTTSSFSRSEPVSPLAFPDIRIRLDDLLI